ncbi:hypothetical protein P7C70_g9260, partial [Phenoliferia sp. Uapishka_3]
PSVRRPPRVASCPHPSPRFVCFKYLCRSNSPASLPAHLSSLTAGSDEVEDVVKDELIDEFEQGLETEGEAEEDADATSWDEGQTDPFDDEEMDKLDADLHAEAQPDFLELDDSDAEQTEQAADGMAVDEDEFDHDEVDDEFEDECDDPDATDLSPPGVAGPGPWSSASRDGRSPVHDDEFDDGDYAAEEQDEEEEAVEEEDAYEAAMRQDRLDHPENWPEKKKKKRS